MLRVPLATSSSSLSLEIFWDIVTLYCSRPHLINRKLLSASQVLFYKISFESKSVNHVSELLTRSAILYEMRKLKSISKDTITEEFIRKLFESYDKNLELLKSCDKLFKEQEGIFISVRILFPRNKKCNQCLEVVVLDKTKNSAYFVTAEETGASCSPPFPYELELTTSSSLRICVANFEDAETIYAEWLADKLFPKLLKWSENYDPDNRQGNIGSLSQIAVDEYCQTYSNLKKKYSSDLVKVIYYNYQLLIFTHTQKCLAYNL